MLRLERPSCAEPRNASHPSTQQPQNPKPEAPNPKPKHYTLPKPLFSPEFPAPYLNPLLKPRVPFEAPEVLSEPSELGPALP